MSYAWPHEVSLGGLGGKLGLEGGRLTSEKGIPERAERGQDGEGKHE